jgi:histidyl-tRNA synthetase
VEGAFRDVCHRYGYREVRTPVFEEAALFARGIGDATDIVSKEMYAFEDRGGRTLALRPEGTAGIVRAFIQHGLAAEKSAWKVYYIIPIFRYERPQAGRYRQSHQVGVECFGAPGPDVDAEVIALNMAWYQDLGVRGHHLSVSSLGCPACRPEHRVALRDALRSVEGGLCETCRCRIGTNPLRVFDCKSPECQALVAGAPSPLDYLCPDCEEHLAGLRRLLDDLELPYEMDPRLVRGLDYYSRTAWEVKFAGLGAQDALAGGGRYDGLVEELGGPLTPGIGFAAGIERALITLERIGGEVPDPLPAGVFLAGLNAESRHRCIVLAERLRALGIRAETDLFDRGLKAQLRLADKLGARFAVLIGENELASGEAAVRDLTAREQQAIPLDQVPEWIAERMRASSRHDSAPSGAL